MNYEELFRKAEEKAREAQTACPPRPMTVVEHANMFDDNSPVVKKWHVSEGLCGLAWISVKAKSSESRKFCAFVRSQIKKQLNGNKDPFASQHVYYRNWGKDDYAGGYRYHPTTTSQSIERKEAHCRAYLKVLEEAGISGHVGSRLD